ncbi:MAG: deoxyribonuclease [Desulfurococcaceae archaeon]|nr:deoxyribonuclease [Desulfurococcaceae archaeon]MCC6053535.1 deoxyribonuclease [Desulfurococcaceae archaeon]
MTRSKTRGEPYTSDIYRYSIYPRVKYDNPSSDISVGQQIVVDIYDIDDKGRGVVMYKGKKIIVPNATLGSRVRVKVVRVEKDIAVANIISVLRETDTVY